MKFSQAQVLLLASLVLAVLAQTNPTATNNPTIAPVAPVAPTANPTEATNSPTDNPTVAPVAPVAPTANPTAATDNPTVAPVAPVTPTDAPTKASVVPTEAPAPTEAPTEVSTPTEAPTKASEAPTEAPIPTGPYWIAGVDFELWEKVLSANVKPGNSKTDLGAKNSIDLNVVDYVGISSNKGFHTLLDSLPAAKEPTKLPRKEWYAFWINIYNILAVNMIITHPCKNDLFGSCGPLDSIRQVGEQQPAAFAKVWGIKAGTVGGKDYSLDDVEAMLRSPNTTGGKPFKEDSRLHSCIVCASISCPNLRNESFIPSKIDQQMHDQMRDFLANKGKGLAVDKSVKKVELTSIFDWFKNDFNNGAVLDWILAGDLMYNNASFVVNETRVFLKTKPNLKYFTYDWDVNGNTDKLCGKGSRLCFPWWALLIIIVLLLAIGIVVYCVLRRRKKGHEYERINNDEYN